MVWPLYLGGIDRRRFNEALFTQVILQILKKVTEFRDSKKRNKLRNSIDMFSFKFAAFTENLLKFILILFAFIILSFKKMNSILLLRIVGRLCINQFSDQFK